MTLELNDIETFHFPPHLPSMAILRKVARWVSIICESRMVSLVLWWWDPERPSSEPASLLSFGCLLASEIVIPRLLTQIVSPTLYHIALSVLLVRLLYGIKGGDLGRQIHHLC